jgi:hypothetical protein
MLVSDSAYCNPGVDLDIQKMGGIDLFGFKCTEGADTGDEQWDINVAKAKKSGYPFFAWHYDNPMQTAQSQVAWFVKHGGTTSGALFLALDVEDQTDYNGKTLGADLLYYHIVDLWNKFSALGIPMIFYSRKSWIDSYCPKLWPFLKDKHLWMAAYPYLELAAQLARKTVSRSWDEFKTKYVNSLGTYKLLPDYDVCLWQFTGDTFCLPGSGIDWINIATPLDVSITAYGLNDFLSHIGVLPIQTVPAPLVWTQMSNDQRMELLHQHLIKAGECK